MAQRSMAASTWPCVVIVTVSVVIAVVEKSVVVVVRVSAFVKCARDMSIRSWSRALKERGRIVMICCREGQCLGPEECETGVICDQRIRMKRTQEE